MSTVTPSESASQGGNKKKNRPGKNQRHANRQAGMPVSSSSSTAPSSVSNQAFFSSQVPNDPTPQPGRYPVVFNTGAGEPTRDSEFAYDQRSINSIAGGLTQRYQFNPRYNEFSSYSGYDDDEFMRDLVQSFLLGIAQHTVHAHVNMGLPLGDFSSVSNSDNFLFTSLASVVRQFGELSSHALGTRFLLKDYASTVSSLVFAASKLTTNGPNNSQVILRMWLPMSASDKRTTFIVSRALAGYLSDLGVKLDLAQLQNHIFSGTWDVFDALKPLLGDDDEARDRFDFLFTPYTTELQFVNLFTPNGRQNVLGQLGLVWANPNVGHLDFSFQPKVQFPILVDRWARKRAAIVKFFSSVSGLANRSAAVGSLVQLSDVSSLSGVTVVRSLLAVSAPEYSLLACFPASGYFSTDYAYNAIVTTSVSAPLRATEFLQLDWLG